ncbi:helix-turn-helix domain-containing protein [Sediminibacillus albus]|uniref:DNA-binding transcriptional regulator, XRE-family HTH domain n=1 Tax=Sediminibacillus albus TaxID=407036 RepID=A0A1G9DAR6_9BACI|nr:helix-turn-helix transcriptional regulator [Sediminibacillus albus]SDK60875.1 DNA-binding transcriptional regulator, XRE-family HTH domain [Sediminibacillus albus]
MGEKEWGRRIKAYRKLKGYTQIQFAHKLGISVSIIGEVERGTRKPGWELLNQITAALGITIEELAPKEDKYIKK